MLKDKNQKKKKDKNLLDVQSIQDSKEPGTTIWGLVVKGLGLCCLIICSIVFLKVRTNPLFRQMSLRKGRIQEEG